jgi:23S rRNA G2069 N7-methylase RlmK/C1962 C5-methylase RlmI
MIDIAKNELKVKTNDFYITDSLEALKIITKKKRKYDLILIDVYGSN